MSDIRYNKLGHITDKCMRETENSLPINILCEYYANIVFTPRLYEMFSKEDDAIASYIKPGREFWHDDKYKGCFRKLKVTYVRGGVMFFTFTDEPENEHAWFIKSFNCQALYAAQIYPYEIGKILSRWHEEAENEFPEICKKCKWYDCDGKIKIDVIWDDKDE